MLDPEPEPEPVPDPEPLAAVVAVPVPDPLTGAVVGNSVDATGTDGTGTDDPPFSINGPATVVNVGAKVVCDCC